MKTKSPKTPKEKKVKEKKLRKNKPLKEKTGKKTGLAKTIIIIVLAVALVGESAAFAVSKLNSGKATKSEVMQTKLTVTIDASGIGNKALDSVSAIANGAIEDIKNKVKPVLDIEGTVKGLVYSDEIVDMVMSMAYPLLKTVLTDLNMMDFAENVSLYPTPARLSVLFKNKEYSCCDKNGERKTLEEVLKLGGDDWEYFDNKVTLTDNSGNSVEKTLWNTITWGITGEASFYKAMGDMSEGLRGVLEVCMQSKEKTVNINLADFLLKIDKINVGLDAATVYNASEKSGYELSLIPLYNLLGLRDGEYTSAEDFGKISDLGELWKAVLTPVFTAVNKIMENPVQNLCDLMINFTDAVDNGSIRNGLKALRLDGTFNPLAKSFMGFEDGLLFNLGDSLIDIINSFGLDLNASFNGLLDGLLQTILKNPNADMPDMDVDAIRACGVQNTLENGNKVWTADSEKLINYLIEYGVQGKTVELVLSQTSWANTPEAAKIIEAIENNKESINELAEVGLSILLDKLNK